uniref:Taste receptor type 2 n=1 Tax=Catharus ustulatus TaxID=91951 RepID=A0A8C3U3T6_CATUS
RRGVIKRRSRSLAIITLEAFAGVWINAFIVCVLGIGWVKKKTLNSNEKILLLLGCSRISFLCFSCVYSFLYIIYQNHLHVHTILQLFASFEIFFNYSNLWISACLCVFYCIKIANFRNRFFTYLKAKIDKMVPWLLLGSGVLALAIAIVAYDISEIMQKNNINEIMQNNKLNVTCPGDFWDANIRMDKHFFTYFFLTCFGYAVPFMAVMLSAVFLLFSLWSHKRKMQTNSMKDLSMEAHIRAMKSILAFLVIYSMNFVGFALTISYIMKNNKIIPLLVFIYLHAFPGVHSVVLIFSNPKLEKPLLKILSCMKCEFCIK